MYAALVAHGVADERVNVVTAEFGNQVVVVVKTLGIKLRVVGKKLQNIGARAALDGRGRPRRQVVGVDVLDGHFDPGLLGEFCRLPVPLDVGRGDEAAPFQNVQRPLLRKGRRLACQPVRAGDCRQGGSGLARIAQKISPAHPTGGQFSPLPPCFLCHDVPP